MGKITSIYLTDEESKELQKFCEENQCTQYNALKTALRELLFKPDDIDEKQSETKEESNDEVTIAKKPSLAKRLLVQLEKEKRQRYLSLKKS